MGRTAHASRLVALVAAAATVAALVGAPAADAQDGPVIPYRDGDEARVALNILPPGQGRYLNTAEAFEAQVTGEQPARNFNQISMYEDLVQAHPTLTEDQLTDFFKDASLGVHEDDVETTYAPRDGLVVQRDVWGVPHVHGETREDVMFGAGYVSGEDRLFMMDVLRHLGRGRVSELLGASQANLAMDRAQFRFADYTDEELDALVDRLAEVDPEIGPIVIADLEAYIEGINAYVDEVRTDPEALPAEYPALQIVPEHWTRADVVAAATMIGAELGAGGGGEIRNALFLDALEDEGYSPSEARAIFDDFRLADDPEAPTKTTVEFPYVTDLGPPDGDAVARPDPGSLIENPGGSPLDEILGLDPPGVLDGPFGPIPLAFPDGASNALMLSAEHSATGRPLAVYGPQVGYWSPQILMEIGLYGPGIRARGAAFPGLSLYVLLGRGATSAWSATSAGGDQVDIWAHELCEPDGSEPDLEGSDHYVDSHGECVEFYTRSESFVAPPSAAGAPDDLDEDSIIVTRTTQRAGDGGIVWMRGTVDGTPVAYAAQRSSYGAEVDSALTYAITHDPERARTVEDMIAAFDRFAYTFQWFFLDEESIGWVMGGYHPDRRPGVDPDLPNWAGRDWDWQARDIPFERTPHEVDPDHGYLTSWNNKQAPGFRAADSQWSYGPVDRVQLLNDRLEAGIADGGTMDMVELVQAMAEAATVDLRGDKLLPLLLEVIGDAGDERLDRALGVLAEWHAEGAHRRDADGDGTYTHPAAVALMDAWWDPVLDAVFEPVLGGAIGAVPQGRDDSPGPVGSAYNGGWYGQLHKDLRSVLGQQVDGPLSRTYCGEGDAAACRTALLDSLDDAIAELEDEFGEDPGSWEADEEGDQIRFEALGLQGQEPMHWQNRPTFQQVLEFGAEPDDAAAPADDQPPLPATGGGIGTAALILLALAAAAVAAIRRDHALRGDA